MKRKNKHVVAESFSGEPIRLQKIIAQAGISSRRDAEKLIQEGRIAVNDRIIIDLGTKANPGIDVITYDGAPIHFERKEYYLYYKSDGLKTSKPITPEELNRTIWAAFPNNKSLFAAGRLDMQSEGLIIITNDGEFANMLTHPRYKIEKVYEIVVRGKISYPKLKMLEEGIWLADGKMRIPDVKVKKRNPESSVVEIKIKNSPTEHVRKIFQKIGHPISRMTRTQIGPFLLKGIKINEKKKINIEDIRIFVDSVKGILQTSPSKRKAQRKRTDNGKRIVRKPKTTRLDKSVNPRKPQDSEFIG